MTKKVMAVILCIAMIFTMNVSAFGAVTEEKSIMQPQYTYINSISATISVKSGTAQVYANLMGIASITKIVVTTELQQQKSSGWSVIESWTQTIYGNTATISESGSVSQGYYYRTVSYFTVYTSSGSESANKTSNQVWY